MLFLASRRAIWLAIIFFLPSTISTIETKDWRPKTEEFGDAISSFGAILLGATDPRENVIFSPISLHRALMMVLLGVRSASRTERDLKALLGCGSPQAELSIHECNEQYAHVQDQFKWLSEKAMASNNNMQQQRQQRGREVLPLIDVFSMVVTKGPQLQLEYNVTTSRYYEDSVVNLDSESAETELEERVNKWSEEAGFAPLLESAELSGSWQLRLITSIRFEASWFSQFEEIRRDHVFYNRGRTDQSVGGTLLRHLNVANVGQFLIEPDSELVKVGMYMRMVEIPLQGGASFIIIEPLEWRKGNELDLLVQKLTLPSPDGMTELDEVLTVFDRYAMSKNMAVELPKFNIENDLDLLDGIDLDRAGLGHTFSRTNKDIVKMLDDESPITFEKATHRAQIELGKSGIKAQAEPKLIPFDLEPPPRLIFEYPFMFLVRFNGMTLLAGKLIELK